MILNVSMERYFFHSFLYYDLVFPAAAEAFNDLVQSSSFSIDKDDRDIYVDCILKVLLHKDSDFTHEFIDLFSSKDIPLFNVYTFYLMHLIKYHGLKSGAKFGE